MSSSPQPAPVVPAAPVSAAFGRPKRPSQAIAESSAQSALQRRSKRRRVCPTCGDFDEDARPGVVLRNQASAPGQPAPRTLVEDDVTGEVACSSCGSIVELMLDERTEYRTFSNSDKINTSDPNRLGGVIDPSRDGIDGNALTIGFRDGGSGVARTLMRTHNRDNSSMNQKTIDSTQRKIANICRDLNLLTKIEREAVNLFVQYESKMSGRSTDSLVGACIYFATRFKKQFIEEKAIADAASIEEKQFKNTVKGLRTLLEEDGCSVPMMHLERPVEYYCHKWGFNPHIVQNASIIASQVRENYLLSGKKPTTITAAIIFMVTNLTGEPTTSSQVSEVTGVGEKTFLDIYKILRKHRQELVAKLPQNRIKINPDDLPQA
ncbi:hypothetical protein H696_00492 [Fonticula alba]|uniref:Transcription factor TFIIB cyclin-like domain-containing protein n=1 Tax=Fonticula alba TaxID=691883 RepID=A0A058ZEX4_FONAL|nr:hypothetical protein H696_00492 [Fonticula alba]KCV72929.1 hypothetical protein H696_00492 [Fonticula alba]|eukprot:XP_009492630.1 hypothetical protein H696_00492 [Fonticula alba]